MNIRYDDVIVALTHDEFDRAIDLIEQMKAQKTLLIYRVNPQAFDSEPLDFEKTTDFLPFQGWESA